MSFDSLVQIIGFVAFFIICATVIFNSKIDEDNNKK